MRVDEHPAGADQNGQGDVEHVIAREQDQQHGHHRERGLGVAGRKGDGAQVEIERAEAVEAALHQILRAKPAGDHLDQRHRDAGQHQAGETIEEAAGVGAQPRLGLQQHGVAGGQGADHQSAEAEGIPDVALAEVGDGVEEAEQVGIARLGQPQRQRPVDEDDADQAQRRDDQEADQEGPVPLPDHTPLPLHPPGQRGGHGRGEVGLVRVGAHGRRGAASRHRGLSTLCRSRDRRVNGLPRHRTRTVAPACPPPPGAPGRSRPRGPWSS